MPRVLCLCEYPTLHGGERSLLATLPAVAAAGFDVTVLAPPSGPLADALVAKGIAHLPFSIHLPDGQRRRQDELRVELAAIFARLRFSLIHANSLAMGRLCGPTAAQSGAPSIAHLRDIVGLSRAAVADLNCHKRLLAVSHATRDFHVAQGLAAGKTHVLYNGVDLADFRPRPRSGWLHRELGVSAETQVVGCIGQLVRRKGQDVLASAAARLGADLPGVHYVFIGARYSNKDEAVEYEALLRGAFARAGMADRAHFLGTRGDVSELLPELAVLVHPARQEPLGRVLLEAAASGVPIIATCVGGTREIFPADLPAAVLVPPEDDTALAAALRRLIADEPARAAMSQAARRRVERSFSLEAAAVGLVRHFGQLV